VRETEEIIPSIIMYSDAAAGVRRGTKKLQRPCWMTAQTVTELLELWL
jgi:hypothetical protein